MYGQPFCFTAIPTYRVLPYSLITTIINYYPVTTRVDTIENVATSLYFVSFKICEKVQELITQIIYV